MIYCEAVNSGVKISIVGMGRHEYLKSMLRSLTLLKTKMVKMLLREFTRI
jgi:hypothetical protein